MSSVKDRAVIELRVAGKSHLAPMLEQAFDRDFRGDLCGWPSRTQSTVQADFRQHIHVDPTANDQVFDGVEVVHLDAFVGDIGQEPSRRRCLSPDSPAAIQGTASRQNSRNGGDGRNHSLTALLQLSLNRLRSVLPLIALGSQLPSDAENALLHTGLGTACRHTTPRRTSGPVHFTQRQVSRTSDQTAARC